MIEMGCMQFLVCASLVQMKMVFSLCRGEGADHPAPLHGSHKNTLDLRLLFYVHGLTPLGWPRYHTLTTPLTCHTLYRKEMEGSDFYLELVG